MEDQLVRMSEEMIELREDNERLEDMCLIVEQMNHLLIPIFSQCKCHSSRALNVKTKLDVLRHKYEELKNSEHNRRSNAKLMVKKGLFNESKSNEKQNIFVTIEGIDERVFSDEEVNFGFVLPNEETIDSNGCQSRRKQKSKNVREKRKIMCLWPGCDLRFRDKYNLSVHMVRHTGSKSFACSECSKTYSTKASLDVHFSTHSNVRPFKCSYGDCSASFARKCQLNVHVSHHSGHMPYKCQWPGCEYEGCYLNRLQAHKMRHTGERPHKCPFPDCEWAFRLNHHLKAHLLKHTGERPWNCDLSSCDKRFQSKQAMRSHFARTHSKR